MVRALFPVVVMVQPEATLNFPSLSEVLILPHDTVSRLPVSVTMLPFTENALPERVVSLMLKTAVPVLSVTLAFPCRY